MVIEKISGSVESITVEFEGTDESVEVGRIKQFNPVIDRDWAGIEDSIGFDPDIDFEGTPEEAAERIKKWIGGDDWERDTYDISELDDDVCCSGCGRSFSQHSWKPITGFDDPSSEKWEYACPTETCDTLIVISND